MPLVDVECAVHGIQETLCSTESLRCPLCDSPAKRVWSADRIKITMDFTDGWDMGAGKYFSTKRERDNWLSEKGSTRLWRPPKGNKTVTVIH